LLKTGELAGNITIANHNAGKILVSRTHPDPVDFDKEILGKTFQNWIDMGHTRWMGTLTIDDGTPYSLTINAEHSHDVDNYASGRVDTVFEATADLESQGNSQKYKLVGLFIADDVCLFRSIENKNILLIGELASDDGVLRGRISGKIVGAWTAKWTYDPK
jgi:hypothetical protein